MAGVETCPSGVVNSASWDRAAAWCFEGAGVGPSGRAGTGSSSGSLIVLPSDVRAALASCRFALLPCGRLVLLPCVCFALLPFGNSVLPSGRAATGSSSGSLTVLPSEVRAALASCRFALLPSGSLTGLPSSSVAGLSSGNFTELPSGSFALLPCGRLVLLPCGSFALLPFGNSVLPSVSLTGQLSDLAKLSSGSVAGLSSGNFAELPSGSLAALLPGGFAVLLPAGLVERLAGTAAGPVGLLAGAVRPPGELVVVAGPSGLSVETSSWPAGRSSTRLVSGGFSGNAAGASEPAGCASGRRVLRSSCFAGERGRDRPAGLAGSRPLGLP